jgi:hypothetical protein
MTNIVQFPTTPEMVERKTIAAVTAFLAKHLAGAPKPASSSTLAAKHISRERKHFDAAKVALGIVLVESDGSEWFWALPGDEHLVRHAVRALVRSPNIARCS